ncbi:uncharacterized protein LOC141823305 isoform X2 [Curcuma longa]|uniref:uncharacterized protein LOC141823305 isoform X2 n=1 Tax=Curcuma longa TaxID=136217 RepID=UPI003D9DD176
MELDRNCSTEENISDSRKEEAEEGETTMLLVPAMNVGISANGEQGSRRKVQWNDRSGNNLVEVLEFEPSDSSDSEENSIVSSLSWEQMLIHCIHFLCCPHNRRQ